MGAAVPTFLLQFFLRHNKDVMSWSALDLICAQIAEQ